MRSLTILPFLALPALAQEAEPPSIIEEGLRGLAENLLREMEPALRDLEGLAQDALPLLEGLRDFDPSLYHPPEVLENGDILIRRKGPDEVTPNPDGSIDL